MMQYEIFMENEDQAMKKLMQGLTNKQPQAVAGTNQIKAQVQDESSDFNFKIEDLECNDIPQPRQPRWQEGKTKQQPAQNK